MGDRALGVIEITTELPSSTITRPNTRRAAPSICCRRRFTPAVYAEAMRRWRLRAHQALGCRGVTRADFRYDDTGPSRGLILLEINTQPGMTPTSLVPELAAHAGIGFAELVRWMVEDASLDR